MIFVAVTFFLGLLFIILPIVASNFFAAKWALDRSIFWRVGIMSLFIQFLLYFVLTNLGKVGFIETLQNNPSISNDFLLAIILGALTGLFIELGRFVTLDRWFKKLRSLKDAYFFSFGWSGLLLLLEGVFLIITAVGLQWFAQLTPSDLQQIFAETSADQMKFVQEFQTNAQTVLHGNILPAFSPLVENGYVIFVDLFLSLSIIYGLKRFQIRYTWFAVCIRTIVVTLFLFFSFQGMILWVLGGMVTMSLLSLIGIQRLQKRFGVV